MPLELALTEAEEWKFKNDSVESELFTTVRTCAGGLTATGSMDFHQKKKKAGTTNLQGPKLILINMGGAAARNSLMTG